MILPCASVSHYVWPEQNLDVPAGNLLEYLSAFSSAMTPVYVPCPIKTTYDKSLAFGPKANDVPSFVLTVGWKQLQVSRQS